MKIKSARFVRSVHDTDGFIQDGLPQVAFVGRSNVGKSTLLNRLVGRKQLARISSKPGRTRAINYFLIDDRLYFVDLPGYGFARVGKQERQAWAKLMEAYFRASLPDTHVIQLVDSKVGATDSDVQAFEYLHSLGADVSVVATKIDKVSRGRRQRQLQEIRSSLRLGADDAIIAFSAQTGEGAGEIWKVLPTSRGSAPHHDSP